MSTLRQLGEREVIRRLAKLLGSRDDVIVGIGDDVAVVRAGSDDLLLTSDAVIETVHFLADDTPERIGHKALGRVLSDFAAMGGDPCWALVDLVAPPDMPVERVEAIYRGAEAISRRHGLAIVGGDTAQGGKLEMHVFGVGRVPSGAAVLRSGAKPGDRVFVTGELGGSIGGKHLDFEPRVVEGRWLRERGVSAMIDISDGLASDLRHITEESGVGAEVDADAIPVSGAAKAMTDGVPAIDHALFDGEDFELLFTVPAEAAPSLASAWRGRFELACTEIGRITGGRDRVVLVRGAERRGLSDGGYEHFR